MGDEPQDARELAARMGIEHYVADERIPFKETIVKNFIDEYKQGRTPNPCVMCNPLFKFRVLAEWADKLDCAYIATGHYSRLEERSGHIYIVAEMMIKRSVLLPMAAGAGYTEAVYLPVGRLYENKGA